MKTREIIPSGVCALCGVTAKLELSHIIPQFVYRWRRAVLRNETGELTQSSDRRIHEEPARQMLCGHCEDLFSRYESEFARLVFHPFSASGLLTAKYGAWLRKFAVSVSWRILEENAATNSLGHLSGRWASEMASCRERWRQYLTSKTPDLGGHHVHLLPSQERLPADNARTSADPAHGRDLGGRAGSLGTQVFAPRCSIERKVCSLHNEAFVYAKLGPIILFGLIADSDPKQWRGTRINAGGKLKPREIFIPERYRDYLSSHAH